MKGQPCEVDVLGMRGTEPVLLGEVKWQKAPLGKRELAAKHSRIPGVSASPTLALWGRSGVERDVLRAGALGFSLEDVLRAK